MADFNERSDECVDCDPSSSPLPTGFVSWLKSVTNFSSRISASFGVICGSTMCSEMNLNFQINQNYPFIDSNLPNIPQEINDAN